MRKIISFLLLIFAFGANSYDLSNVDTLITSNELSNFVEQMNSKQVVYIKYSPRFSKEFQNFLLNNPEFQDKFVIITEQRSISEDIKLKNNFPDIVFTSKFVNEFRTLIKNPNFFAVNSYNQKLLISALSRLNFSFYEHLTNNCYKTYPNDRTVYIPKKEMNTDKMDCKLNYIKM